jgi:preprotein translocase subunit SecE
VQELLRGSLYKRSQGRVTRQVTFAALAITVALGAWQLSGSLGMWNPAWKMGLDARAFYGLMAFGLPGILLLAGWWIVYRIVNFPGFADFLIAVEAEMNKVSWPSRNELIRGSMVVLAMLISLAVVLAVFDLFWQFVFNRLGVL